MTFADHLRTHQDAHNGVGWMPISYGSVCSGIEAASVAWHHLGWIPRWFAEIEPFPSAVLAHHWPEVSNLGDFTLIRDKVTAGTVEAPDVLVGGTPCQAFSVAGLRQSLDDKRGQLTLEFVRLANAIDSIRSLRGQRPVAVVWENVPGVLNTPDNAFGCFLAGLVGEDDPLVAPGGRWSNAGYVRGPARAAAWRILDAQYFGVAQRRRRVFVVASARNGFDPTEILFEFDGVRRDSPPRREAGKGFAADAGTLAASGGGMERPAGNANELDFCIPVNGSHWDGGPHPSLNQSNNIGGVGMSNQEIFSQRGAYLAPHPVNVISPLVKARDGKGFDASEDGTGRGAGAVAVAFTSKDYGADASEGLAPTMRSMGHDGSHANGGGQLAVAFGVSESPDLGHCLRSGASKADKHESTTYIVAPQQQVFGGNRTAGGIDISPSLLAQGGRKDDFESEAFVTYGLDEEQNPTRDFFGTLKARSKGGGFEGTVAIPEVQVGTLAIRGRDDGSRANGGGQCAYGVAESPDVAHCLRSGASKADKHESTTYVRTAMQVRRLTPTECERLQGFPDGHTLIPWRGKPAEDCPDGPRYKALGNSMAVPVMRWIGARIARQLEAQA